MSDKQELVLALERFAKACQNDYVNEAVNKTEVNLKKNGTRLVGLTEWLPQVRK